MELGLTWVAANIIPADDFQKARADSAYSPEELIKATQMTGPMTWKDATQPDLDRIASLVRHDLYDQFGDRYVFHPVIAERRVHYGYDETEYYYGVLGRLLRLLRTARRQSRQRHFKAHLQRAYGDGADLGS